MESTELWSIGQVARHLGIRASAIRFYESEGLVTAPRRIGGQRRYDEAALARLGLVRLAQSAGFSVSEIRTLVAGFGPSSIPAARWRQLVGKKRDEIERQLEELRTMKKILDKLEGCRCPTLEDCGRAALKQQHKGLLEATARRGTRRT